LVKDALSHEIIVDTWQLRTAITALIERSDRNFVLREGHLLTMMPSGGWILFGAVDAAPHQVERLILCLEKDPTLAISESMGRFLFRRKIEPLPMSETGGKIEAR
jgi:hypothetical protein